MVDFEMLAWLLIRVFGNGDKRVKPVFRHQVIQGSPKLLNRGQLLDLGFDPRDLFNLGSVSDSDRGLEKVNSI